MRKGSGHAFRKIEKNAWEFSATFRHFAFYGTAALTYAKTGINEDPEVYAEIAADECAKMEEALRRIAVENEPDPAKIDWKLWSFIIK